jgi:hypothetical protein
MNIKDLHISTFFKSTQIKDNNLGSILAAKILSFEKFSVRKSQKL